jgi:hypothetical protein
VQLALAQEVFLQFRPGEEVGQQRLLPRVGLPRLAVAQSAEQVDVIGLLRCRQPAGGHETALHVIFERMAEFCESRHVRHALEAARGQQRDRAQLARLPEADGFGGVVDAGIDVSAGELGRYVAAAAHRHIGVLDPEVPLQQRGDKAVFLSAAGATHSPRAVGGLHRGHILLDGLDAAVGIDPQREDVHRHARQRGEFLDVHADVGLQRRREIAVQRRHHDMRVARAVLEVAQRLGARAAPLVDRQEGQAREAFLLDDRLEQPREPIRAAALTGHDHHLHRAHRLPLRRLRRDRCRKGRRGDKTERRAARDALGHFSVLPCGRAQPRRETYLRGRGRVRNYLLRP